eukprot:1182482-Prorocentrum_minimum.AAC.3
MSSAPRVTTPPRALPVLERDFACVARLEKRRTPCAELPTISRHLIRELKDSTPDALCETLPPSTPAATEAIRHGGSRRGVEREALPP